VLINIILNKTFIHNKFILCSKSLIILIFNILIYVQTALALEY